MAYVFPAKGHEPGQPRPGTDGPILVYDFDGPPCSIWRWRGRRDGAARPEAAACLV